MESWEGKNSKMEKEKHFSHIGKVILIFKTELEILPPDEDGISIFSQFLSLNIDKNPGNNM